MVANMWKNSLKNVESDNNKILFETVLEFVLQWNGTYCLNKPRNWAILKVRKQNLYQSILWAHKLLYVRR